MELKDIPLYLEGEGGVVSGIKVLGVINETISTPYHLENVVIQDMNTLVLLDILAIQTNGIEYLAQGKCIVCISKKMAQNVGKVVVLEGTGRLRAEDYVEVLNIYRQKNELVLYATKKLAEDVPNIQSIFPKVYNLLVTKNIQNNVTKLYEIGVKPPNYRIASICYEGGKIENYVVEHSKETTLVSRDTIKVLPLAYDTIRTNVFNAADVVKKYLEKNLEGIPFVSIDKHKKYTYTQIKKQWHYKEKGATYTGRALFKDALIKAVAYSSDEIIATKGITDTDMSIILSNFDLLDAWGTGTVPTQYLKENIYVELTTGLSMYFYLAILDELLSLKGKLLKVHKECINVGYDLYSICVVNPYLLALVDSRLSIDDLDLLASYFGIGVEQESIQKFRNQAYMHNYMLDTNNYIIDSNTVVLKSKLLKEIKMGHVISKQKYNTLQKYGATIKDGLVCDILQYLNVDLNPIVFVYPTDGWIQLGKKYMRPFKVEVSTEEVIQDYISSGLGIEVELNNVVYMADYNNIYKETYILDKLYRMHKKGTTSMLDRSLIDKYITSFEDSKSKQMGVPFKLESKQKEAAYNIHNHIFALTGPGGSGKTTTSELLVYILNEVYNIEYDSMYFCGPTGAATQRLKEVLKRPCRTLHSKFRIGGESYATFIYTPTTMLNKGVLFIDETSMVNLDLMFQVLLKVDDDVRIIFLGDVAQLPPIGVGKPFYNLLQFLPCTVLEVTKRAEENSGINKNNMALLDKTFEKQLHMYPDCKLLQVEKDGVPNLVSGIIKYHTGLAGQSVSYHERVVSTLGVDVKPDDIQVIVPVKGYEWGTQNLNKVLQDVYNPLENKEKAIRVVKFIPSATSQDEIQYMELRVGDRVMHLQNRNTKSKFYNMQGKYLKLTDPLYIGVMNGDKGKIKSICTGEDLKFVLSDGTVDTDTKKLYPDNNKDVVYIEVEYIEMSEQGVEVACSVFYKAPKCINNKVIEAEKNAGILYVEKDYLQDLDLAYALTTHKMQGGQAKLTIVVLYAVGNYDFISRNMVYTASSRASKGMYIIGDVVPNGIINKARGIEQNDLRLTLIDILVE